MMSENANKWPGHRNIRAIKRAASSPLSLSLASYFQWLHSLLAAWALDLSKALTESLRYAAVDV